ncbi:MAG: patatin-like phospholipase RssA [Desulfobacterales bacterium]|nr:patatin-like phospholipase RssA [Desulfobacterales bacterium]
MSTPRIGLALGSGSARGLSHIGVIRALAAMGIRPDIIAGCSVGAMVGGAYAAGHIDELETWLCGLDRMDVLGFFDVSLTSGGVILGERLTRVFRDFIGNRAIEDLPIPFAAVATDLTTGREIWLDRGPLIDAVRASMGLPGLFAPVQKDGQWLVDGGLVNPVPISICRAMGADIVIAVNLNGRLVSRHLATHEDRPPKQLPPITPTEEASLAERLKTSLKNGVEAVRSRMWHDETDTPGLFDVMASAINIMQDRITRSRMAGDPPDLSLRPKVDQIGLLEVHRAAEAIEAGWACVKRAEAALSELIELIEPQGGA